MTVHIPHQISQAIGSWVFRRIAPAAPEALLSPTEYEEMRPRVLRFDRYALWAFFASFAAITALATYTLHTVNRAFDEPARPPLVYDSRRAMPWLGAGLFLGILLAYVVTLRFTRWWWKEDIHLHDRYEATRTRYDQRRAIRLLMVLFGLMGGVFAVYAWKIGTVIDGSGIRFKTGWTEVYRHTYADVSGIGHYRRFQAPIGVREIENVRIIFKTGPALELTVGYDRVDTKVLNHVTAEISERSGREVEHGDIRPGS